MDIEFVVGRSVAPNEDGTWNVLGAGLHYVVADAAGRCKFNVECLCIVQFHAADRGEHEWKFHARDADGKRTGAGTKQGFYIDGSRSGVAFLPGGISFDAAPGPCEVRCTIDDQIVKTWVVTVRPFDAGAKP